MSNELKQYFTSNSLHHAYLLEGDPETLIAELLSYIQEYGVEISGNPDVAVLKYNTFTIENGRELKSRQGVSALLLKKFFIIQTEFFNAEAQHALLKVFEEPAKNVHFFIVTSRADVLLDTLASRLIHIKNIQGEQKAQKAGKAFLVKTKPERLLEIAKIIKSHKEDKDSGLLRSEAITLLNGIEAELHNKLNMSALKGSERLVFEQIAKSRKYLNTPGASVKMLLESIAVLAPEK